MTQSCPLARAIGKLNESGAKVQRWEPYWDKLHIKCIKKLGENFKLHAWNLTDLGRWWLDAAGESAYGPRVSEMCSGC